MKKKFFILTGLFMLLLSGGIPAQSTNPPDPPDGHGSGNDQPPGGSAPIGSGLFVLLGLGSSYAGKKILKLCKENKD